MPPEWRLTKRKKPARPGVVGVCDRCDRWVTRPYVDAAGHHTAIMVYGKRRGPCGGKVRPLWQGAFGP